MMLKWDTCYEIGHERIDAEHRIFLGLIVDFEALVNQGAAKDKLIRTLKEICKYAEFHFFSEQNVMIDCHYPEYVSHTSLHQQLLAAADDQLFRLTAGQVQASEVFEFLFEWFALHTSTEDKKLVAYTRASPDPAR
ncbi:bacteriohemerythrin [mine drainage metagenome]|uniref:Bacteriohemerythrin n=1 Tax=mine drainage metagenome TaxID=410659 RepID=A0A1J5PV61_9ZZZZ